MQKVPWMCWKRMSDNWKAYFLAYAWPMPISSRILWSFLLQNHFKLNRDFSCQLKSCEILSILVSVLLGNGQVLERNQEHALAGTPDSPSAQPCYLILASAWREEKMWCFVQQGEGRYFQQRLSPGHHFPLIPKLCPVGEMMSFSIQKNARYAEVKYFYSFTIRPFLLQFLPGAPTWPLGKKSSCQTVHISKLPLGEAQIQARQNSVLSL